MSKSLGEKLNDAIDGYWGAAPTWADLADDGRTEMERTALAFCANLSHDETATATIEALKAERDSLLAALKPFADAFAQLSSRWLDHEDHWPSAVNPCPTVGDLRRAAALTTKEG